MLFNWQKQKVANEKVVHEIAVLQDKLKSTKSESVDNSQKKFQAQVSVTYIPL